MRFILPYGRGDRNVYKDMSRILLIKNSPKMGDTGLFMAKIMKSKFQKTPKWL